MHSRNDTNPSADQDRLRELRLRHGFSREALGARAGGYTASTIWRIENGDVTPRRSTRSALARALGVDVDDLFPVGELPDPDRNGTADEDLT